MPWFAAMDYVVGMLTEIAISENVAMDVPHHSTKAGSSPETSAAHEAPVRWLMPRGYASPCLP
jgi:hypothetical protein